MILLLGASGFLGRAFAGALVQRGQDFTPLSRRALDYSRFDLLFDFVRRTRPRFIINAAGVVGRHDLEQCDSAREETLAANTLLPQTVARVCRLTRTPWGHVSSGCIYRGAKIKGPEGETIETDLSSPAFRHRLAEATETIRGFTELDEPNFSFRHPPCSFYSGSKALAEEALAGTPQVYIWRPGVVFDHRNTSRNLLWQLRKRPVFRDRIQPLSHVDDFVRSCLSLWEREARYGIYNIINPGIVTTGQILRMIRDASGCEDASPEDLGEWRSGGIDIPNGEADCVLDGGKLEAAGIRMRSASEALCVALRDWTSWPCEREMLRH